MDQAIDPERPIPGGATALVREASTRSLVPVPADPAGAVRHGVLRRGIKRVLDIVGSAVLIVLTLPLAIAVAVAVKLDSPGPVFFMQRRIGRFGVPFPLIKFRTMVRDAELVLARHIEADEARLLEWRTSRKLRSDPRVTRLGRFLRRSSLDELPQLVNVMLGNMSLVGPRPVVAEEVFDFGERAERILSVRPGLTGLWAVSGRNDVTYEERVELESTYAVGWTLWTDVKILVRTIPAVLRGHGAY
jgi:lipopolysaccharide/colanic/teichoic acid biosynthesis glycosyltransferase